MVLLSLDMSTKTGWSLFKNGDLIDFGVINSQFKLKEAGAYPWNYVKVSNLMAKRIIEELVVKFKPDEIVIEETNKGKNRYTQKILEFTHRALLAELEVMKSKVFYLSTSSWRHALGQKASRDDIKNNKLVNKANREGKSKKSMGLTGKITAKHRSIKYVNERLNLNLRMKDNDKADAICVGLAYLAGATICDGT